MRSFFPQMIVRREEMAGSQGKSKKIFLKYSEHVSKKSLF